METMCQRPVNGDSDFFLAMSIPSERNEIIRLCVSQRTFASPDRMNDGKMPISVVEVHRRFSLPIRHARSRAEQPTMKAAQEEDTVRDRRKAPAEFLGRVGWSVEVPQVFDLVGIEPGFDVGEEAAVDLQMRLQAPHKIKNGGAVPLAYRLCGIEAQANVMISPDADCRYITKQPNRFLDALTPIKHVTQA